LRAKRGNLLFPQDKLHETISHPGVEIATHLSGARNDTFTKRWESYRGFEIVFMNNKEQIKKFPVDIV